jgi:hypothetical protein
LSDYIPSLQIIVKHSNEEFLEYMNFSTSYAPLDMRTWQAWYEQQLGVELEETTR